MMFKCNLPLSTTYTNLSQDSFLLLASGTIHRNSSKKEQMKIKPEVDSYTDPESID